MRATSEEIKTVTTTIKKIKIAVKISADINRYGCI
jgi:hypothetical protein